MKLAETEPRSPRRSPRTVAAGLLLVSAALAALLLHGYAVGLGQHGLLSPAVLCWILVSCGIAGTAVASSGVRLGWLVLFGLQPIWIAYALATDQAGLILGCLFSGAAYLNGFLRRGRSARASCPAPSSRPDKAAAPDTIYGAPI